MADNVPTSKSGADDQLDRLIAEVMHRQDCGQKINIDDLGCTDANVEQALSEFIKDSEFFEGFVSTLRSVSQEITDFQDSAQEHTDLPGTPGLGVGKRRIANRYEIISALGRGGMGSVYLAHDRKLGRKVALKFGNFSTQEAPDLARRFQNEARALAKLQHPNFCQVFDVDIHESRPFISMQFIDGCSLADYVSTSSLQPIREVVKVIRKLAAALADLHEKKMLHRDIKPANIMITSGDEPVIVDFGLARKDTDPRLTVEGVVVGTPQYMSPDQIQGRSHEAGPTADIHSLGVVFYQLLTGKLPYASQRIELLAVEISARKPLKPSQHCADVDPMLDRICMRMMAGFANERYAAMADVARDLASYLQGKAPEPAEYVGGVDNENHAEPIAPTVCRLHRFVPVKKSTTALAPIDIFTAPQELGSTSDGLRSATPHQETLTQAQPQLRYAPKTAPPYRTKSEPLSNRTLGVLTAVVLIGIAAWAAAGYFAAVSPADHIGSKVEAVAAAQVAPQDMPIPRLNFKFRPIPISIPCPNTPSPHQMAFDRTASLAAVASVGRVDLYDVPRGKFVRNILETDAAEPVLNLASSRDGSLLVALTPKVLHVWDFDRTVPLQPIARAAASANDAGNSNSNQNSLLAVSRTGKLVCYVDQNEFAIISDAHNGTEVQKIKLANSVSHIRFAGDDDLIVGDRDGGIVQYRLADGQPTSQRSVHKVIHGLDTSTDGRFLAVAPRDKTVQLMHSSEDRVVRELPGTTNVQELVFSPDGKLLATASDDRLLRVWNADLGGDPVALELSGHPLSIEFSPDGLFVFAVCQNKTDAPGATPGAAAANGLICCWMLSTASSTFEFDPKLVATFYHPSNSSVGTVALSPDGKQVAAAGSTLDDAQPELRISNLETGSLERAIPTAIQSVKRLRWSPSGERLAAMSTEGRFQFWDPRTGNSVRHADDRASNDSIAIGSGAVLDFDYSPDCQQLILVGSLGVEAIDATSLKRIGTWSVPGGRGELVARRSLEPGAIVCSGGGSSKVAQSRLSFWKPDQTELLELTKSDARSFRSIDVSRDDKFAAVISQTDVSVWSMEGTVFVPKQNWPYEKSGAKPDLVTGAIAPDGSRVLLVSASGTSSEVVLLSSSGQEICAFTPHRDATTAVCFSDDGEFAITAGGDATVKLWKLPTTSNQQFVTIQWILRQGGEIKALDRSGAVIGYTSDPQRLTDPALRITGVMLNNCPGLSNGELKRLSGLSDLLELQLMSNAEVGSVTDAGLNLIDNLPVLRRLYLDRSRITDDSLANLRRFPALQHLRLRGTRVSNAGVAHLNALPNLQILDLGQTSVDDAVVSKLNAIPGLTDLYLDETKVTDAIINEFGLFEHLKLLDLRRTAVNETTVAKLRELCPNARILLNAKVQFQ